MREEDMETKNPTVAVVMCTYNGEKYLREQMDSILAQTYPIHEIIVQDDRSTDGTVALLQNIAVCGRQRKATWQPYAYGLRNYRALLRLCRLCLRHRAALLPPPPPTSTRPRLARRHQGLLLPLHLRMALLAV